MRLAGRTASRVASKLVDTMAKQERAVALERQRDAQQLAERVIEEIRRTDPEGEIFGATDRVKDPLSEPLLSEMETGEETSSRPINRFRSIVYNEGELDKSDLRKPPSPDNPHPFDPNSSPFPLPPTHSRSLTPYANHLPILQRLLDLGVNLLEVERTTKIAKSLVRLDWERDAQPKVHWLIKGIGVPTEDVGSYLTRNPFFLLQDLGDLKKRVGYLLYKRFPRDKLAKVVTGFRYWLNMDIPLIDSRLGWMQRQFGLRGDDVRHMVIKEPRVIQFGLGPIQRLLILLNRDKGFSREQMKRMLLDDPRLFMMDPIPVFTTYNYLAYVMGLSNAEIAKCPQILRCSVGALRRRHEFLHRLGKAQYCEEMPNYVPLSALIHPSDRHFAETVAGIHLEDYDRFLKLL